MLFVILTIVALVASTAISVFFFKYPFQVLRNKYDNLVVYAGMQVVGIHNTFDKYITVKRGNTYEILTDSPKLVFEYKYKTNDGFYVPLKTTISAQAKRPELLPIELGSDWNRQYASKLVFKTLQAQIEKLPLQSVIKEVAQLLDLVNNEALKNANDCPFHVTGIEHEFGKLNDVEVYRSEFTIRERAAKPLPQSEANTSA